MDSMTPKADPSQQKPPAAAVAQAKPGQEAVRPRKRIPFSNAKRRFETTPIDGFYQHIFLERNVTQALDAGYEFVNQHEIEMNSRQIGGKTEDFKGTDLGTRVSWIGDRTGNESGGPERCYLMKIRQEWRTEDVKELETVAQRPLKAIFHDEMIAVPGTQVNSADPTQGGGGGIAEKGSNMYTRITEKPLFNRPARKAKIGRQA